MCIGLPMQVVEDRGFFALCRGRNGDEQVNMMLIGPQPVGTWIVNFLGSARDVISEEDAEKIDSALDALSAVMSGASTDELDRFFPDLAAGTAAVGTA